jgi:hypothetical protein
MQKKRNLGTGAEKTVEAKTSMGSLPSFPFLSFPSFLSFLPSFLLMNDASTSAGGGHITGVDVRFGARISQKKIEGSIDLSLRLRLRRRLRVLRSPASEAMDASDRRSVSAVFPCFFSFFFKKPWRS